MIVMLVSGVTIEYEYRVIDHVAMEIPLHIVEWCLE